MNISEEEKKLVVAVLGPRALVHLVNQPNQAECSLVSAPSDKYLQAKLSSLVDNLDSNDFIWNYAIFWQISRTRSGDLVLGWKDGDCRETKEAANSKLSLVKGEGKQQEMWKRVLEKLHAWFEAPNKKSIVSGFDRVSEMELFFYASMYFLFPIGEGEPGSCFQTGKHIWHRHKSSCLCVRSDLARAAGIKTVVLIPTENGIVELGTALIAPENLDLVDEIKNMFNFPISPQVQISFRQASALDREKESYIAANNQQQLLTGGLSSSRAVIVESIKPANGREEPINPAAEAERQRRKILTQRISELRALVPIGSKSDRISVIDDTVRYITQLKQKVEEMESIKSALKVEIESTSSGVLVRVWCPTHAHPLSGVASALEEARVKILETQMGVENGKVIHTFLLKPPGCEQLLREKLAAILSGN